MFGFRQTQNDFLYQHGENIYTATIQGLINWFG